MTISQIRRGLTWAWLGIMITWISSWLWCFDLMSRTYERILVIWFYQQFRYNATYVALQRNLWQKSGSVRCYVITQYWVRYNATWQKDRLGYVIRVSLITLDKYKREGFMHENSKFFSHLSSSLSHVLRNLFHQTKGLGLRFVRGKDRRTRQQRLLA